MLLPGVFRDQKEKAAKETTLIHAMNRLGAVSPFFRFSNESARTPDRRATRPRKTRETRAAVSPVSRLQSCARSYDFIGKVIKNRIL